MQRLGVLPVDLRGYANSRNSPHPRFYFSFSIFTVNSMALASEARTS